MPWGSKEIQATLDRAMHAHRSGMLDEAEKLYRAVLSRKKNQFESLHFLGVIEFQRGRHEQACHLIEQSLQIDRGSADALANYARVLNGMERYEEALKSCDEALKLKPGFVQALVHRGNALRGLKQFEKALASFDEALRIQPDYIVALNNRGNVLNDLGRYREALACYERLLKIKPDHAEAAYNHGNALLKFERRQEALASFDKAIAIKPDYAEAYSNRGNALLELKRLDEALACFDKAIAIKRDYAEAYYNRANALWELKRPADALADYDQAIAFKPAYPEAYCNRGMALLDLKLAGDALASYDKAIAIKSDFAEAHCNRGGALLELRRLEEAVASYDRALAIKPDFAEAAAAKFFAYDFIPGAGFAEHQELRRNWYRAHAQDLRIYTSHANSPDPSRRLVVGYVSPDFKHHSAALAFRARLLRHDHASFEVVCYSDVIVEDEWTQEFRRAADKWRPIQGMRNEAVAEQIRGDKIDILVDLAGHSAGNRLLVFALKPAPVQVTHGTGTGFSAIDYLFSDPVAVPQSARMLFAEAIYDLPCLINYEGPSNAPMISELPGISREFVTFGCFNRLSKISPLVLELWARILHAVPGSRLLLKDTALADSSQQVWARDTLAAYGIASERIELRGGSSHREYLAAFNDVDIALDPFPQNGGISTWEALWMGVPVVAKLGNSVPSRISAAILSAIGLSDWIAEDEDAYAALAIRKAADLEALARLRKEIRPAVSASPAGNPVLYTRAVEDAYRNMWHRWCASKGASTA